MMLFGRREKDMPVGGKFPSNLRFAENEQQAHTVPYMVVNEEGHMIVLWTKLKKTR